MMQKRLIGLILIAQIGTCLGMSKGERFFVEKLMPAADEVDGIFSGKRGKEIFAINSSVIFKKSVKTAVNNFIAVIDAAPGNLLKTELEKLENDGVLANWQSALDADWVTTNPKDVTSQQKKAVGNIMTIYTGSSGKRVLASKVSRLITEDYLVLKDLATKLDGLFASKKFGLNTDKETKKNIQDTVKEFLSVCKKYDGIATEAVKDLTKHEVFACWDLAIADTGWLDVERDGWKDWKNDTKKTRAYRAVTHGVQRIMELYLKDKTLVLSELNKIFLMVRDILVGKARLYEIAQERKNRESGTGLLDEDLAIVASKIMPNAQILDEALRVITMNASREQKEIADAAVQAFTDVCKSVDLTVVDGKELTDNPIINSWNKTKAIESWFNLDGSSSKYFADWKKNYPSDYKKFGTAADGFMRAYSKSKTAMQNMVKGITEKAKREPSVGSAKELDKEEEKILDTDLALMKKLAGWTVPTFKMPDLTTKLPEEKSPESSERGEGTLGLGEKEVRELFEQLPAIEQFAGALRALVS